MEKRKRKRRSDGRGTEIKREREKRGSSDKIFKCYRTKINREN